MLRVSWLSSQLEKSEAIDPSHDQFATRIEVLTVETIPVLVLGPPRGVLGRILGPLESPTMQFKPDHIPTNSGSSRALKVATEL